VCWLVYQLQENQVLRVRSTMPVSHVRKVAILQACSLPLMPSCVCRGTALPAADCRRPDRRLDTACLGCGCALSSLPAADCRRPDRRLDADCLGSGCAQSSSTKCKLKSETSLAEWIPQMQPNVISVLSPSLSSTMRRADCNAAEGFRGCGSLSVHRQDGWVSFVTRMRAMHCYCSQAKCTYHRCQMNCSSR
jgi:hypothetical protein